MNVNVKENIYFSVFHGSAGGIGESSFHVFITRGRGGSGQYFNFKIHDVYIYVSN